MIVAAITAVGHQPVVIARSTGVDLITGDGLDAALAGVDSVIDVSNVSTLRRKTSVEFFTNATTQLLLAGEKAGVRHHVALSIVGLDRVMSGDDEGKRRQERLVLESPQPASVLRATQFHEFVPQILGQVNGPIAVLPQMRSQPIAAREVADALLSLALEESVGMAPELAGPQVREIVEAGFSSHGGRAAAGCSVPGYQARPNEKWRTTDCCRPAQVLVGFRPSITGCGMDPRPQQLCADDRSPFRCVQVQPMIRNGDRPLPATAPRFRRSAARTRPSGYCEPARCDVPDGQRACSAVGRGGCHGR